MRIGKNLLIDSNGISFVDKHGKKMEAGMAMGKIINRISNWFLDLQLYFLHAISKHLPFWKLRKLFFKVSGIKIGKGSTIHMGTKFFNPGNISIGEDSIIGDSCFLDGRSKLKIGNHVDIASEVMIYNSEHEINNEDFTATEQPVFIGDYTFLGPRSIILPGVKIGKGAIIAAGAVVTKDIGEFKIVAGVPAKEIGERTNKDPNYILGRARLFQ